MAFRRGDDSQQAYLGAMILADHIGLMNTYVRSWHKVHAKK
jgi:hypothetical protein